MTLHLSSCVISKRQIYFFENTSLALKTHRAGHVPTSQAAQREQGELILDITLISLTFELTDLKIGVTQNWVFLRDKLNILSRKF